MTKDQELEQATRIINLPEYQAALANNDFYELRDIMRANGMYDKEIDLIFEIGTGDPKRFNLLRSLIIATAITVPLCIVFAPLILLFTKSSISVNDFIDQPLFLYLSAMKKVGFMAPIMFIAYVMTDWSQRAWSQYRHNKKSKL